MMLAYWLARVSHIKAASKKRDQVQNSPAKTLRACLHGGGGPQVGEVTRLGGVTRLSI